MATIARIVDWASRICGVAASILLLAACVVISESVFVRYVLESSTIWQTEFVKYAVVASTLLGCPYVLSTRGHVSVDLISGHLAPRSAAWFKLVAAVIGCTFCIALAWSGWEYFHEAWRFGWVTESVWAPRLWIILLPLPLGVVLTTLQYVIDIARLGASASAAAPRSGGIDP